MSFSEHDAISGNDLHPTLKPDALIRLRAELLRFATLQLRNAELAEDVVQEALAAAVAAGSTFEQRASYKTWVFSILKNKIIDVMRDRWNRNKVELSEATGDPADFDGLFNKNEHWRHEERPSDWGNPEASLESREFWQIFELCMHKLPEATARVFAMREFLGLETEEICKELELSPSNCWVILHRARMSLRVCLQQNWFEQGETP
jgi:RNA polymerase sigma-70 factor, ECF subfamily